MIIGNKMAPNSTILLTAGVIIFAVFCFYPAESQELEPFLYSSDCSTSYCSAGCSACCMTEYDERDKCMSCISFKCAKYCTVTGLLGCSLYFENDPLYPLQWHLENAGQTGGEKKVDIGLFTVPRSDPGLGVTVAFLLTKVNTSDPDLVQSQFYKGSYDFTSGLPSNLAGNVLSTATVSIAVGTANNEFCGIGVASYSNYSIIGVHPTSYYDKNSRLMQYAINYQMDHIQIYLLPPSVQNYSSGFADLSEDVKFAFTKGRIEGASGKGNIFVRGAGDLGNNVNANYDPISSQLGVINVGSVDHTGNLCSYSQSGSSVLIVAPGGSAKRALYGSGSNGVCESRVQGTTPSASIVTGIIANILQRYPSFTWLDIIGVLIKGSTRLSALKNANWIMNGAGIRVSEKYGNGIPRLDGILEAAEAWLPLPPMEVYSTSLRPHLLVPDQGSGKSIKSRTLVDVHGEVRFIKVWASLSHIYSGDIELSLQSPAGTVIKLSNSRESYGTAPTESESINVAVTVCDSHTCNSPVMLVGNSAGTRKPFSTASLASDQYAAKAGDNCCTVNKCYTNIKIGSSTMPYTFILDQETTQCTLSKRIENMLNKGGSYKPESLIIAYDITKPVSEDLSRFDIPVLLAVPGDVLELTSVIGNRGVKVRLSFVLEQLQEKTVISNFQDIPLGTWWFWGEVCRGTWTLIAEDKIVLDTGYLQEWGMEIHYNVIPPSPSPSPIPSPSSVPSPSPLPPPSPSPSPSPSFPSPSPTPSPTPLKVNPNKPTPTPTPRFTWAPIASSPSPSPGPETQPSPSPVNAPQSLPVEPESHTVVTVILAIVALGFLIVLGIYIQRRRGNSMGRRVLMID